MVLVEGCGVQEHAKPKRTLMKCSLGALNCGTTVTNSSSA